MRYERPPHDRQGGEALTRRAFVRRSALSLAGATLFACTGGGRMNAVAPRTPTGSVSAADTRWPIKRVVYLMMENRSFDNLYGRFPGANGTTVGVKFGREVPLTPAPHWLPGDLPHDRAAHLNAANGWTYDGFGIGQFGDPWAYTVFEESMVPNYYAWARDYVLCDNFFASVAGPSYPNHFFFVAGQAGGVLDNPENIETRRLDDGRVFKSWGCDAVGENVYVFVKDDKGNLTMLAISPYARRGYVDDAVGEFSSPVKFIQDNWGLPYLTDRIERTHNFEHVFDFGRNPRRDARPLPRYGTCFGTPWEFPGEDYPGWPEGTDPEESHFVRVVGPRSTRLLSRR